MFIYCLQCSTQKTATLIKQCERKFSCTAISPKRIRRFRRNHVPVFVEYDLLPGYIYLYSEQEPLPIWEISHLAGVTKVLGDRSSNYNLIGTDRDLALMLFSHNGVIDTVIVQDRDGHMYLPEDAFAPLPAEIIKVERRKSRMQIKIACGSSDMLMWVGYEVAVSDETASAS